MLPLDMEEVHSRELIRRRLLEVQSSIQSKHLIKLEEKEGMGYSD